MSTEKSKEEKKDQSEQSLVREEDQLSPVNGEAQTESGLATKNEVSEKEVKETVAAKSEKSEDAPKKEETAADLLNENLDDIKIRKAKNSKNITSGICCISATFNNTKVSFSDMKGNVISWSSSGKCNFRGSRKSTAYAAQIVTQDAGRAAISHGCKEVMVKVKGPGMGRDSAIRALQVLGFVITSIIDVTPIPHNGCRPRNRRRV